MDSDQNNRVLIVDDQREIHDDFDEMLGTGGTKSLTDDLASSFLDEDDGVPRFDFELLHATSGEQALEVVTQAHATQSPIAAAYVDIRMPPGIDGIETIRRIRGIDRHVEIIIMTAYTDQRFEDIVQNMELLDKLLYIRKPFAREEIQQITLSLVSKWNMERELHASRSQVRRLRSELQRLREESQGS